MKLFYKEAGAGPVVVILHGLLGSLDNWASFAKQLVKKGCHVITVDQRNHGHSPHSGKMAYDLMAVDLKELLDDKGIKEAVFLGHSMGGKTAMVFSMNFPEYVAGLLILDIAPKKYPNLHQHIFDAMLSLPEGVSSRREAHDILQEKIIDFGVLQFIMKNLYWNDANHLSWRPNVKVLNAEYERIGEVPMDSVFEKPVLFVRGEKSDYILDTDFAMIRKLYPLSEIKTAPNAGHWVHAENPQYLLEALIKYLNEELSLLTV